MTRILTAVHIRRPVAAVFDYVTTPANWPCWHPASLLVSGPGGRSLLLGEQVVEDFRAAGLRGRCTWRVIARETPYLWSIETEEKGGHATIVYRLRPEGDGTLFERELVYTMPNAWLALFDAIALRRRMERESSGALERLKQILEILCADPKRRAA